MKKTTNLKGIFILYVVLCFYNINAEAQGHFKIRNDEFIQIGYDQYKTLSFGNYSGSPNNGHWAIEYYNGGLNFWKPWPSVNSGNYRLFLSDNLKIGINRNPIGIEALQVNGGVIANYYIQYSDVRLKKNISSLKKNLITISMLNPISYDYDKGKMQEILSKGTEVDSELTEAKANAGEVKLNEEGLDGRYGFSAQEVQKVLPNLVHETENGYLSVNYLDIIPILVGAINEQQKLIEEQTKKIEELKEIVVRGKDSNSEEALNINSPILEQNTPNPFSENTIIKYDLGTEQIVDAQIVVYDMSGKTMRTFDLNNTKGRVEVRRNELSPGIYAYSLIKAGSVVDSKIMVLTEK